MATHSSVLAWRIPGMVEPGGLPSRGSQSRTRLKRLSSSSSNIGNEDITGALFPKVSVKINEDKAYKSRSQHSAWHVVSAHTYV